MNKNQIILLIITLMFGIVYGSEMLPIVLKCDNFKFQHQNNKVTGEITINSRPINAIINGYICYIDNTNDKITLNIDSPNKINITKKTIKNDTERNGILTLSHKYFNGTFAYDSAHISHTNIIEIQISISNPFLIN